MEFSLVQVTPGVSGAFQAIEAVHELFESETSFAIVAKGADLAPLRLDKPSFCAEPAVLLLTSGSSSKPRSVEIPLAALAHSAESAAIKMQKMAIWLTALPVTSMGGLNTIIRSALTGIEPVIWDGIGGANKFEADNFLPFIKAVKTASLKSNLASAVSLVPTQLFRLTQSSVAMTELAELDFVLVGGGPTSKNLKHMCDEYGVNLISTYGATETAGGCVFNGEALDGYEIQIVNGLVQIKSPYLAWGYRDGEALDGIWNSNDRGEIADGKLVVTGRADSLIKVAGVLVDIQDLELKLQSHYQEQQLYVVAKTDSEYGSVPLVVSEHEISDLPAVATQILKQALPIRFKTIAKIPMLPNGKPDRVYLASI